MGGPEPLRRRRGPHHPRLAGDLEPPLEQPEQEREQRHDDEQQQRSLTWLAEHGDHANLDPDRRDRGQQDGVGSIPGEVLATGDLEHTERAHNGADDDCGTSALKQSHDERDDAGEDRELRDGQPAERTRRSLTARSQLASGAPRFAGNGLQAFAAPLTARRGRRCRRRELAASLARASLGLLAGQCAIRIVRRRARADRMGAQKPLACGLLALVLALAGSGCGASRQAPPQPPLKLPPDERPVRIGRGPRYRVRPVSPAVARRATVLGLRCAHTRGRVYAVHLELYARRLVLPVPAGIGVAPPQRREGVYVLGGPCSYPLATFEPTGVVVVDPGPVNDLRTLFAIWGEPLSRAALASFRGPVLAFLGGRRWRGAPGTIPLRRHAEIVLEVDGSVAPHPSYRFPPGL